MKENQAKSVYFIVDTSPTPEDFYSIVESRNKFKQILAALSAKQKRLLVAKYLDGSSIQEISAELGISTQWAKRMERKILQKIKTNVQKSELSFGDLFPKCTCQEIYA